MKEVDRTMHKVSERVEFFGGSSCFCDKYS